MERPIFNFTEPKKKRGTFGFETGPFPVPIETVTGVENGGRQWCYYQGHLKGNSVVVNSLPEMQALYQMGFFGKGSLSWSSPDYNVAVGKDRRPMRKTNDETFLRLMTRRRYEKHSEWHRHNRSTCDIETKSINAKDIEADQSQGTREMKSTSSTSSSCPQALSSGPQPLLSCPEFSSSCPESSSSCSKSSSSCPHSSSCLSSCPQFLSSGLESSLSHPQPSTSPDAQSSCRESSSSYPQSPSSCPQPSSSTQPQSSGGIFEDSDTLVVEDSEEDTGEDGSVSIPKKRLKESVMVDPFPLREHLQLGLEEAFFLSYGLGCLIVMNDEKGPMNLTEMWQKFLELSPSFVSRYVAYHNFRSKGWVVRTGIKYGVDFVLYKKGPPFYHSSYSTVVIAVDEGSNYEEKGNFDWTTLCCANRVTEQVSKELMFCYVVRPANVSDEELRSPRCISRFKVSEVIVRRWISKKERENAEHLEMP